MPVAELEKFRQKYPQYNDLSDVDIADRLAKKYPNAYGDLPDKVKAIEPQKSKSLTDVLSSSDPVEKTGDPVMDALIFTQKEIAGPIARGANTAAFGIPRAITKKIAGEDFAKQAFPEQSTIGGKIARFGSEAVGLVGGGPGKVANMAAKGAGKAVSKVTGRALVKKMAQGIAGGAAGGALLPTEDFLDAKQRGTNALSGAAIGAALPVAGAAVKGVGKGFEAVGKSGADYVTTKVAPKAYQMYQESVKKFTPQIQSFARKLNVPEGSIKTLQRIGVERANKIRTLYSDSTDAIYRKIQGGFEKYKQMADSAYKKAAGDFKGNSIDSSKFYQSIQRGLRKKGWVDLKGNPTTRYKGGLDPVADKLTDLYIDMRPSATATAAGKRITGKVISKEDFFTYRDALGNMLKEKPSDSLVMSARNALYDSAEKSGMSGIKNARNLEAKYHVMRKRFLDAKGNIKALGQEQKLDKFQKMTKEQVRQLREIEQFTGQNFVDDLDALTSAREADKLISYNMDRFARDFNKAVDPKWTKYIQDEYKELLGPEQARKIFSEIRIHRAGRTMRQLGKIGAAGAVGAKAAGSAFKAVGMLGD